MMDYPLRILLLELSLEFLISVDFRGIGDRQILLRPDFVVPLPRMGWCLWNSFASFRRGSVW